jgi:hypothetical protein
MNGIGLTSSMVINSTTIPSQNLHNEWPGPLMSQTSNHLSIHTLE